MKEVTRNFVLGLTSIVGAVGLVVLLMLFGELDALIKPRYRILINTDNAAGLRTGSTVELSGVPIGTVDSIDMIEDGGFPVRIVVLIDEGIRIASDIVPFATSSPLGGSATLQLDRPRDHQPVARWLATDGTAEVTAAIRSRLVQQARDALENFIAPLVELAHNLNRLLELPDPEDPDAVAASIRTTVVELNRSLSEIESLVISLNEVFGAPDLSDPEAARASVRTTIISANEALEHYSSLAQKLEEAAGEAVPALTSLESALNEVQLLAHQARAGDGTVGQLMTNPDLFRSLQDTLETLDELLIEMRVTVQRIRAEGINVHF